MDIHIRFFRCLHFGRSWRTGEGIPNDKEWRDVSPYPRLSHAQAKPYIRDQQSFRDSSTPLTIMPPNSSVPFITTVLLANIPQLLLSVWYFAYNAIMTRLQLSQEWPLYSISFRPLRVSQPRYLPIPHLMLLVCMRPSMVVKKSEKLYANKCSH